MPGKTIRRPTICAAFLILGFAGAAADGASIVSDGGFEAVRDNHAGFPFTGAIDDGWVVTSNGVNIYNASTVPGSPNYNSLHYPHSGSQFAFLGDVDFNGTHDNTLTQMLATTPGQTYTLSFYASGIAPDNFYVKFGDQLLYDGAGRGRSSTDFELYTFVATADSAQTLLSFTGLNSEYGYGPGLDDVSVVPGAFPNPNPDPVPEPSALAVGAVVLAFGVARLRRKSFAPA